MSKQHIKHNEGEPVQKHFKIFKDNFIGEEQEAPGVGPVKWVETLGKGKCNLNKLPEKTETRSEIKELVGKSLNEDEYKRIYISIMAWGNQGRGHQTRAWENWSKIYKCIQDAQKTKERKDAYEIFKKAKIPGLGASYFTKLLFFLADTSKSCYIMDQWTAKSINVLFGMDKKIISLDRGGIPAITTDGKKYEQFCQCVDKLASKMKISEESVEIALFSKGGRGKEKQAWRAYVELQYAEDSVKKARKAYKNAINRK